MKSQRKIYGVRPQDLWALCADEYKTHQKGKKIKRDYKSFGMREEESYVVIATGGGGGV